MTSVRIKSELQARTLRKLCAYLDAYPAESRALAESLMIDLLKHLTITQTEDWCNELDRMLELSVSWSAETETEL